MITAVVDIDVVGVAGIVVVDDFAHGFRRFGPWPGIVLRQSILVAEACGHWLVLAS